MPKKPKTSENPFGKKLLAAMREQGIADDFAALAREFKVAVPSVYDWVNHGRFSKERFPDLVTWSGRSLHWWFDIPDDVTMHSPRAREPEPPYRRPAWPFERISEGALCSLPRDDLLRIEGAIVATAAALGTLEKLQAA